MFELSPSIGYVCLNECFFLKVEILSDLTPVSEKWYVAMIALVSSIAAFFGLLLLPASVANFRLEAAASSFGKAVTAGLKKVGEPLQREQ